MRKDSEGYRHNEHSVGLVFVHLVWCPKRRKSVLKGKVRARLIEVLQSVAIEKEWVIKAVEVVPDHVHLLVEYDPKHSVAQVVRAFKGRSSRLLRKEFPHLLKLPSLWPSSYFYDSTGKVSTEKVVTYINDPHHW